MKKNILRLLTLSLFVTFCLSAMAYGERFEYRMVADYPDDEENTVNDPNEKIGLRFERGEIYQSTHHSDGWTQSSSGGLNETRWIYDRTDENGVQIYNAAINDLVDSWSEYLFVSSDRSYVIILEIFHDREKFSQDSWTKEFERID